MGNEQRHAGKLRKRIFYLAFQLPAQKAVQRCERLVQQNRLRLAREHAAESYALHLPAGEFARIAALQPFQMEARYKTLPLLPADGFFMFQRQSRFNILQHRHVGKQRVPLKQIPDFTLLRRQVDLAFGIVEHASIENDPPRIRLFHARNAPKRHAFAAAGSAEQRRHARFGRKRHVQ